MNTPIIAFLPGSGSQESRIQQLEDELIHVRQRLSWNYDVIVIHHQGIKRIIPFHQIMMLQSQSNYSYIFLITGEKILTSKTLKHWCDEINDPTFIRVHASFFINPYEIKNIEKKTSTIQMNNGILIRYSRRFDINRLIKNALTNSK